MKREPDIIIIDEYNMKRGRDLIIIGKDEPNPWAVETAISLLKYDDEIKKRLKKEGIPVENVKMPYDVCNGCALYTKNLKASVREDILVLTGKEPESCWGIRIHPSLDKDDKLVFYADSNCKGYIGLDNLKKRNKK